MQSAFSEKLPCELDDREVKLKADELARELKNYGEIEKAKAAASSAYATKLKASRALVDTLATMVRTGVEFREIGCTERKSVAASTVEVIRMDTGEVVRARPMEPHEKQAELFSAGYAVTPKPKKAKAEDASEDTEN